MADKNPQFGSRLKSAIKSSGLKQVQLAEKINVTATSISYYAKHGRVPEWDILVKIADLLGVSTDWLLTGKGPKPTVGGGMAKDQTVLQDALIPVLNPALVAGRLTAARELVGRSRKNINMALQAEKLAPLDFEAACTELPLALLKSLAGLYGLTEAEIVSWAYEEPIAQGQPVAIEAARTGYRLKRLRGAWEPELLAKRSGIYPEHILWYEGGIGDISPDAAALLAGALDCKPDDITGHGPMPSGLPKLKAPSPHPSDQDTPGYVAVRLPRGDPGPVPEADLDYLEKALVILRHPPQKGDWAGALKQNLSMFYTGVQQSNQLSKTARGGRQRKIS